jgi:hypothetical protein
MARPLEKTHEKGKKIALLFPRDGSLHKLKIP